LFSILNFSQPSMADVQNSGSLARASTYKRAAVDAGATIGVSVEVATASAAKAVGEMYEAARSTAITSHEIDGDRAGTNVKLAADGAEKRPASKQGSTSKLYKVKKGAAIKGGSDNGMKLIRDVNFGEESPLETQPQSIGQVIGIFCEVIVSGGHEPDGAGKKGVLLGHDGSLSLEPMQRYKVQFAYTITDEPYDETTRVPEYNPWKGLVKEKDIQGKFLSK
jgi:hypothetical protein